MDSVLAEGTEPSEREPELEPWARTFDILSHEYGWSDDHILDLTLGRIEQIIRQVIKRKQREAKERTKLAEAVTRHIAMFSAQTKEAAKAAAEIELWAEKPQLPHQLPGAVQEQPSGLLVVESDRTPKPTEARPDEPLDDSERKVVRAVPEDQMNKVGSFGNINRLFSLPPR